MKKICSLLILCCLFFSCQKENYSEQLLNTSSTDEIQVRQSDGDDDNPCNCFYKINSFNFGAAENYLWLLEDLTGGCSEPLCDYFTALGTSPDCTTPSGNPCLIVNPDLGVLYPFNCDVAARSSIDASIIAYPLGENCNDPASGESSVSLQIVCCDTYGFDGPGLCDNGYCYVSDEMTFSFTDSDVIRNFTINLGGCGCDPNFGR